MSYKKISILALITVFVVLTLLKLISNNGDNTSSSTDQQSVETSDAVPTTQREFLYVYGTQNKPSSVLVQIDSFSHIELVENHPEWIKVRAKIGLPVWVKSNVLSVEKDIAYLNKNTVTHSIPIATQDTLAGELTKGIKSKVIDTRDDWTQILTPKNYTAWISKQELADFNPKSGIKSKEFLKRLPGLALAISKPKVIAKEVSKEESIQKEPTKTSVATKPKNTLKATATTSSTTKSKPIANAKSTKLTVYNSTNQSQQVLAEFSNTADLEISSITHKENQKTWVKVSNKQGFAAWAPSKYFQKNGTEYTANSRVFLRTSPELKRNTLFAKLDKGDPVEVIKKQNNWFQVKSAKKFYAWVDSKQLTQFKK